MKLPFLFYPSSRAKSLHFSSVCLANDCSLIEKDVIWVEKPIQNYKNPSAGIGDPYWYEWMVGLLEIVNMLNSESGIKSVTLQDDGNQGIDDVVVEYEHNHIKYMQIKHTREEGTLTFGSLVATQEGGQSLLAYLSQAWKTARSDGFTHEVHLYTNKKIGESPYTFSSGYRRPSLKQFLDTLNGLLKDAESLEQIAEGFTGNVRLAWQEWCSQLGYLENDTEKLLFLKSLKFHTGEPDLPALEQEILNRIQLTFKIGKQKQYDILKEFVNKLRIWTTTRRGKNAKITRKAAYEALCLEEEEPVGWHGFDPPEPFFESFYPVLQVLERELLQGDNPIVFFQGLPGSGKTSIVSKLCKKGNVIDLRFHAFYPISPESQEISPDYGMLTTPEALWGDLLVQLRRLLTGQLYEYKVPLRKDFLSFQQMRDEVLRISSEYSHKQGGRPTILCIDGIDHAARGNDMRFLDSLIPPEKIPTNVRLLIVGQPPTDKYPVWLKSHHPLVTRVTATEIKEEDVSMLFQSVAPDFKIEDRTTAIKLIVNMTQGNTLACVFAVYEASLCKGTEELEDRLIDSSLHSDLSAYYEHIWQKSVQKLPPFPMMLGEKVAACLSLCSERLSGVMLHSIFKQVFTPEDGTLILQRLFPLVIQDNGGFRLMHNDVRVFLRNWLEIKGEVFQQVASFMADYYWNDPNANLVVKHRDLFQLLMAAGRKCEQANVFNVDYVLEAWEIRSSLREIINQAKEALSALLIAHDWNLLHEVLLGISTLDNIYHSVDFLKKDFDHGMELPPLLISERRVLPLEDISYSSFFRLLKEALLLAQSGEEQRATALVNQWLKDQNPEQVLERYFTDATLYWDGPIEYNESLQKLLEIWGRLYGRILKVFQRVGILKPDLQAREDVKAIHRVELFNWAYLDEAINLGGDAFQVVLYEGIVLDTDGYESILQKLVLANRWEELGMALKKIEYYEDKESVIFTPEQQALWALLSGDPILIEKYVNDYDDVRFYRTLEYTANVEKFALRCLVYSYIYSPQELSIIELSKETSKLFNSNDELRENFFFAACLAGRWLAVIRKGDVSSLPGIQDVDWQDMLQKLLRYDDIINRVGQETRTLKLIFMSFNIYIDKHGLEACKRILYKTFINHARKYPYDHSLENVWRVLSEHQQNDLLAQWARVHSTGENSILQNSSCYEEQDQIANQFVALLQESGLLVEADEVRKKQYRRWSNSVVNSNYFLTLSSKWLERILEQGKSIPFDIIARLLRHINVAVNEIEIWKDDYDVSILAVVDKQKSKIEEILRMLGQCIFEQHSPAASLEMFKYVLPMNERSSRRVVQALLLKQKSMATLTSDVSEKVAVVKLFDTSTNISEEDSFFNDFYGFEKEGLPKVEYVPLEKMYDDLNKLQEKKWISMNERIYHWSCRLWKEKPIELSDYINILVGMVYKERGFQDWRFRNKFVLEPILDQLKPEQAWQMTERIVSSIINDSEESFFHVDHLQNIHDLLRRQITEENLTEHLIKNLVAQDQWINIEHKTYTDNQGLLYADQECTWETVFAELHESYKVDEFDDYLFK